jgi:hypothetical protein
MPKVADLFVELGLKKDKFDKGMKDSEQAPSKLGNAFAGLGGQIAAAFSVAAVLGFAKAVIDVTAEFQKFQAVLTNTLGSGASADSYLKMITQFAAKTPFSVQQLTDAFVKLANQGFIPSEREMTKLGDLASSTGKSFDQLAEAIIDATTGQFERLKEFGIKAAANGDKVAFSFKGVTTEVDNTSAAIRQYILGLGEAEGVTGAMAAISETLGGKISNLGDSWDQFMLSIGNSEGPLGGFIETLSQKLNELTTIINDKSIPAWKEWLAILNIGPYRNQIVKDAQAIQNEADQAAWRMEQLAVPTFDYKSIIDATAQSSKKFSDELKKQAIEAAKLAEKMRELDEVFNPTGAAKYDYGLGTTLTPKGLPGIGSMGLASDTTGMGPIEFNYEELATATERYTQFIADMNSAMSQFTADFIGTFAEGIGQLMSGNIGLDQFFNTILSSFGGFITQMGKMLIAYGIGMEAFKKAFTNPFAAIAAGVALTVIGGLISGLASKGPSMSGSSSGMSGGGMGGGGGDYRPWLDGGNGGGQLVAVVKGSDLLFTLERAQRNSGRVK